MNQEVKSNSFGCGGALDEIELKTEQLAALADSIKAVFHPKKVLEVGCKDGLLVRKLRDRGIEAYGIEKDPELVDLSDEFVRPYLAVADFKQGLPKAFPEKYDIVLNFDQVEYLPEQDAASLIKWICTLSNRVIFSSSSEETGEFSRINVQMPEYWAKQFSANAFFHSIGVLENSNVCVFDRSEQDIAQVVSYYERTIRRANYFKADTTEQLESEVAALKGKVVENEEAFNRKNSEADSLRGEIARLNGTVNSLSAEYAQFRGEHFKIMNSIYWKVTAPLRALGKVAKKMLKKKSAPAAPVPVAVPQPVSSPLLKKNLPDPNHAPTDPIRCIFTDDETKRLNLVTDSIDPDSLLGGTATAMVCASEIAKKFGYELRIVTRRRDVVPTAYWNQMKISGVTPPEKVTFYSDYWRYDQADNSPEYNMEVGKNDVFFATSWWSAKACLATAPDRRLLYIIQEIETFFYDYGDDHFRCSQIMQNKNIDFIVNSSYLYDYFKKEQPNIVENGCWFEPAFPKKFYTCGDFKKKEKYKLFFYSRPRNPRNLFNVGVELLDNAIEKGVLNTDEWEINFVGQDVPDITFIDGSKPVNLGRLTWEAYAKYLSKVDLGLCLMYTPHPSYPPYDLASSGGVVLSNKMLNKQTFDRCKNVIMADLTEEGMLEGFRQAIALAKDVETRKRNYAENTICRDWKESMSSVLAYFEGKL